MTPHSPLTSVLDLFSIGIGPSSSHTVGPMRAAGRFVDELRASGLLTRVAAVGVQLFGSLGATGHGHGTPGAVVLGLEGYRPDTLDIGAGARRRDAVRSTGELLLGGEHPIAFDESATELLPLVVRPRHTNALHLRAHDTSGGVVAERTYYSIGGGFVVAEGQPDDEDDRRPLPYPFSTARELLDRCARSGRTIAEVVLENETTRRSAADVRAGLLHRWEVMAACIETGSTTRGLLPGRLGVRRRAADIRARLEARRSPSDPADAMDWLNVAALAVNEENAAGGRIVTAPTNGAAGIVPAVLFHALRRLPGPTTGDARDDAVAIYLLTAGAIAVLVTRGASISGAEVGCQGEVGSACAMAAAGFAALLGGTPVQIENAAEIALEHNLGLTCDPVGGLVQIPCIERNAIASVKAVTAANLAMHGNGTHRVSLDQAIATVRQTGADMLDKYKETSTGGLAVNVVEC